MRSFRLSPGSWLSGFTLFTISAFTIPRTAIFLYDWKDGLMSLSLDMGRLGLWVMMDGYWEAWKLDGMDRAGDLRADLPHCMLTTTDASMKTHRRAKLCRLMRYLCPRICLLRRLPNSRNLAPNTLSRIRNHLLASREV